MQGWVGLGWGGVGGQVNTGNLLLHAEDAASPESPRLLFRTRGLRSTPSERSSCGFAEVDILSLFKRALQAAKPGRALRMSGDVFSQIHLTIS